MNYLEHVDIWKLLGGLGVFMFAMFMLEASIKEIAGRSFKGFIRKQTNGRLKSILSGSIVTAILQSSSAVSLMVLAFVGAGIMAMDNAIGVILGSNLGTTATAWLVAAIGFKVNIEAVVLPVIGIGGLILIFFGKSKRYSNISKLLVSFGLLFMGLNFMKESVEQLSTAISISDLPNYNVLSFLVVGMLVTAAMQSSSATIALILTGINAQLLDFEGAAAMVIGANVGTTATVLIGGINSSQIKKRVALSHLSFNVITAVVGLIMLWPITYLIEWILGPVSDSPVIAIALFHTIFNLLGVVLIYPFIGSFARLLIRLIPERKADVTTYIHQLMPSVYDAATSGLAKEIDILVERVMQYNLTVVSLNIRSWTDLNPFKKEVDNVQKYEELKLLQTEIFEFATKIHSEELNDEENRNLERIMHAARQALNAAKVIKDIEHNVLEFDSEDSKFLSKVDEGLKKRMSNLYTHIKQIIAISDHESIAELSAELADKLRDEDTNFVKRTMKAVNNKEISDLHVSEALMVNRAYIHSSHMLIHAVIENKLNPEEMAIFDRMS